MDHYRHSRAAELADLTNEAIDQLTGNQIKEWIRRVNPFLRVSGEISKLRACLRRERDTAVELRYHRARGRQEERHGRFRTCSTYVYVCDELPRR